MLSLGQKKVLWGWWYCHCLTPQRQMLLLHSVGAATHQGQYGVQEAPQKLEEAGVEDEVGAATEPAEPEAQPEAAAEEE